MSENETPQRVKPLTSREVADRLHEQTMAALTRVTPQTPPKTPLTGQYGTGPKQGEWYCKELGGNPYNADEDAMAAWSREFDLIKQVRRDLTELNATKIEEDLRATLNRSKS